jgi:nucleotide-binding universal stress UspA family protein
MAESLVVGVDGSAESLDALDAAIALARQAGARIVVVHVQHEPGLAAFGENAVAFEAAMAEALEANTKTTRDASSAHLAGTGIDWCFDVRLGDPADELMRVTAAQHAKAIIVGGKAHGVVGGLLVGSVAQKLVRRSPVSVVVVRDGEANRFDTALEREPVSQ